MDEEKNKIKEQNTPKEAIKKDSAFSRMQTNPIFSKLAIFRMKEKDKFGLKDLFR